MKQALVFLSVIAVLSLTASGLLYSQNLRLHRELDQVRGDVEKFETMANSLRDNFSTQIAPTGFKIMKRLPIGTPDKR